MITIIKTITITITEITITIKMPANFNKQSPTFENGKEVYFSPWRYGVQD